MSEGWPSVYDVLSYFRTYRIGPSLAYSMGDINGTGYSKVISILQTLPKKSNILLSFGEIDCRAHLIRQKELQKKPIEDIVKDCVDRYFSFLTMVKNLEYKVIAWGVIPTCNVDEFVIKNPELYPHYGTYKERNYATKVFNKYLKELCHNNGMEFLSISDLLIDSDLKTLDSSYYKDSIHLSLNTLPLIMKEIEKIESYL